MKIGHKLLLGFLLVGFLVWPLGYYSMHASQEALIQTIGQSSALLAEQSMLHLAHDFANIIEEYQAYSKDLTLQNMVSRSNLHFDKLDKAEVYIDNKDREWVTASEGVITPFMRELIDNELARELRDRIKFYSEKRGYSLFGEIFVTNKYGANVAQTGTTTDYRQSDERWWVNAKRDGVYLSGVHYDESAAVYSVDIAIRIDDRSGDFAGTMKVVMNIEGMIGIIEQLATNSVYKDAGIYLLDTEGVVIFSNKHRIFEKWHLFDEISGPGGWFVGKGEGQDEALFAFAMSRSDGALRNMGAILVIEYDSNEVFRPVYTLRHAILFTSLLVTVFAIGVSLYLSRRITAPLKRLKETVLAIGKGNLEGTIEVKGKDEVSELVGAFKSMREDLRETTISVERLNTEIAERERVQEALSESERRYKSLFECAGEGIIVADIETKEFRYANPAACTMLGYSEEELKEMSVLDIHPQEALQHVIAEFQAQARGEKLVASNIPCLRNDGVTIFADINTTLVNIDGKQCNVGFFTDITDRKRAEEQLQGYSKLLEQKVEERTRELRDAQEQLVRQERLTVMGQMAGGLGHELRNPLGAIKNAVYFLGIALEEPDPEIEESIKIIEKEVSVSQEVITSLLCFAQPEPPKRVEVDIAEIIREALSRVAVPGNVEVVSQPNGTLPVILADAGQLHQVFGNIVLNSIQAMPDGGRMVITAETENPEWVNVSISDTGVAMDEQVVRRIMEPLFTTKARGIGLGLSLSRILVEAHGGDIEVESKPGKGSRFTVRLPVEPATIEN